MSELEFQTNPTGIEIRTVVGYLAVEVVFIDVHIVAVVLSKRRQLFGYPEVDTGTDKRIHLIVGFVLIEGFNIKRGSKRTGLGINAKAVGQWQATDGTQARAFKLTFHVIIAEIANIDVFGFKGKEFVELLAQSRAKQIVLVLEFATVGLVSPVTTTDVRS